MSSLEKIKILEQRKKEEGYTGPYLLDISPEENKWEKDEINKLKLDYPFLPQFYLDFIKEYDSLGLAWVSFFGSKSNIIPIWEEIDYWKNQMRGEYFPFGKDADGSIYAFNKKGNVIYFCVDDYEWENPIYTSDSLEEFIDECLLGKRYGEFDKIENNTFYEFLHNQGWA